MLPLACQMNGATASNDWIIRMLLKMSISGGGLGLIQKLAVRVDPIAIFIDDVIICNTIIINLNERLKARIIIRRGRPRDRVLVPTLVSNDRTFGWFLRWGRGA